MIVAIDGPAGTGKSTVAGIIAKKLGITYLNSGSFYRALTLAALKSGIDLSSAENLKPGEFRELSAKEVESLLKLCRKN